MDKQEKHPIDELFAKRLYNAEQTPTARAWDELEGRLAKKKDRKKGWYMAVAASVALLAGCFVGLQYWTSENNTVANTIPATPSVQSNAKAKTDSAESTQLPLILKNTPALPLAQHQATPSKTVERKQPKAVQTKRVFQLPIKQEDQVATRARAVPAIARKPEISVPEEMVALTQPMAKPETKPAQQVTTIVVVELPENAVVHNDETASEPPAAGKARKFWQAIKKAKQSEINLDKEALFAWVKEKNTRSNQP